MRFANIEAVTRYVDEEMCVLPAGWAMHRKLRYGRANVLAVNTMIGDMEWRIHQPSRDEDFSDYLLFISGDLSAFILAYGNRPVGRGWAPWYQSLMLYTATLNTFPLHKFIEQVIANPDMYPLNAWLPTEQCRNTQQHRSLVAAA